MNLYNAAHDYISKILNVPGLKCLLLDEETTGMIGMVYTQSEIIAKQVFLVERIDKKQDKDEKKASMHHLAAVCLIRPTRKSINHLKRMLKTPKYKEYHFFFTNIVSGEFLQELANADEFDLVCQVQEYFCDYYVLDDLLFHARCPSTLPLLAPEGQWGKQEDLLFERNVACLLACLLSVKKRPVVRYQRESPIAKKMAITVMHRMKEEADLFHTQGQALLLVIDRRSDPVTPLLQQWTYQAMVHELIGIQNNRVDLSKVPDIRKELREVVLHPMQDEFYRKSMYLNFGELGKSIKGLVAEYQVVTKDTTKVDTIEDMQRFVDNYPEFKQMAGNVSKHVTMMQELSRLVSVRKLMDVSELEQELACSHDHSAALEGVTRILDDGQVRFDEKLRLVMLYALRYERERNSLTQLKAILRDKANNDTERGKCRAVDEIIRYAGSDQRGGDLFGNNSLMSKATRFLTSGLQGVENIYTQHKPLLQNILEQLSKGKLKPSSYPFMDSSSSSSQAKQIPKLVIVFVMGGVTYEEQACVAAFNRDSNFPFQIMLGGSCVHNSRSFVEQHLLQMR